MVLLDNDGFLTQLTHLLQKTRTSGTVNITMKRYHGQTKPKPKPRGAKKLQKLTVVEQEGESRCLFRATNGKKKLSTVVNAKDVNRFQLATHFTLIVAVFTQQYEWALVNCWGNLIECFDGLAFHPGEVAILLAALCYRIRSYIAYANVLKANMDNLKKRDKRTEKSKAKKSKATQ